MDSRSTSSSGSAEDLQQAALSLSRPASPADVPHVLLFVFALLCQRDRCSVALVCREWHRLASHPSLWKTLSLQGARNAGQRLPSAVMQARFCLLREVDFEFAQGLEDLHLSLLADKDLRVVNLNACQKVTDAGVVHLCSSQPKLTSLSIYWNLKITNRSLEALATYCPRLQKLNISGCKNVTNVGLHAVARSCHRLTSVNLTRCIHVTDAGVINIIRSCTGLTELYLYADSNLTDLLFTRLSTLHNLHLLDLCGMQHLTDKGLEAIGSCTKLRSLNLTWCVQITDAGLAAIAYGCQSMEVLSLYGIRGITDSGIEALARGCSTSLTTLDVNGCVNIMRRSQAELLLLFPKLQCFLVHS
eukprot:SM000376S13700  [mRNA]  locus=s376:28309:31516:+ [translate_table: standard]